MIFLFFITVNMHKDTKLKLTLAFSMLVKPLAVHKIQ